MRVIFLAIYIISTSLLLGASSGIVSLSDKGQNWRGASLVQLQYHTVVDGTKVIQLDAQRLDDAELLLNFEPQDPMQSLAYEISASPSHLSTNRYYSGQGSAVFYGNNPIKLIPGNHSLFAQDASDFTIDFWINPMSLKDGEIIFEYKGKLKNGQTEVSQTLTASFDHNGILWQANNIFYDTEQRNFNIRLHSSPLYRNIWHHHTLRYKSDIGMLELLDNGKIVDVQYVNEAGKESPHLYVPTWKKAVQKVITVGEFAGYLDDLSISTSYLPSIGQARYISRGSLIIPPYDLRGKILHSLDLVAKTTEGAVLRSYIRFAPYPTHFAAQDIAWIPYETGQPYTGTTDRFMQVRIDFFAGDQALSTPVLQDILINAPDILPPPAPKTLSFIAQGQGAVVSWQKLYNPQVIGYKLYFGKQSGDYFGHTLSQHSPIDVGDVSSYFIDNLQPGQLYYFSLTSYDEQYQESEFAPEKTFLP